MTLPHSPYAPTTNPQMGFLDDTNAALGQGSIVSCTAAGTNAIALTPLTNTPAVTAYTIQGLPGFFGFVPANTSTAAATIAVAGLAALNAYLPDGVTQAAAGAFNASRYYVVAYSAALNGGSGGFYIVGSSPLTALAGGSGSAATPALYFQGDTNTGLAQLTSKTFSAVVNGNEVLRFTPTLAQFSGISISGTNYVGTTTNDSAPAGDVGEFISSTVNIGSAISLTTASAMNVTSIALTAGDWDVWGNVGFNMGGATVTTTIQAGLSVGSNVIPAISSNGSSQVLQATFGTGASPTLHAGNVRHSLSATTTIYLVASAAFTTSTAAAYGFIGARRRR